MKCKYCGSESLIKKGFVKDKQLYKCKDCGHRFYLNGKFARMKTDKSLIVTALNLYYDGLSLRKTQYYVRPHQSLGGKTPAQVAKIQTPENWENLIERATQYEARLLAKATRNTV